MSQNTKKPYDLPDWPAEAGTDPGSAQTPQKAARSR